MAIVNIQLGQVIADAVSSFAKDHGFDLEKEVDLIGGQGQTIWHSPLPELFEGDQMRAHLDMAKIAIIAAKTAVTSLGSFRVSGMALDRQGCPLFAALDSLLLNHPTLNRAVQNIGGIGNFSILPKGNVEGATTLTLARGTSSLMLRFGSLPTASRSMTRMAPWAPRARSTRLLLMRSLLGLTSCTIYPRQPVAKHLATVWRRISAIRCWRVSVSLAAYAACKLSPCRRCHS